MPTPQPMKGDCSGRVWAFKEKCVGHQENDIEQSREWKCKTKARAQPQGLAEQGEGGEMQPTGFTSHGEHR